jgi:hypothetical protein
MNLKKYAHNILIISSLYLLIACSSVNLRQELAGTDTIEVIFYNPNGQAADTVWVRDKSHIWQLLKGIENKDIPPLKCGYQGKLNFRKSRVKVLILEAEFNLMPDCAYISFLYQNKLYARELNSDGVAFLELAKKYKEVLNAIEMTQRTKTRK